MLLPPRVGRAQAAVTLAPHARIRYALPPGTQTVVANVLGQRGDSLWVRPAHVADTVAFALPNLVRLDVSRGSENHMLAFAVVGFICGSLDGRGDLPGDGHLIFGAVGAAVGVVAGWVTRRERWAQVWPSP